MATQNAIQNRLINPEPVLTTAGLVTRIARIQATPIIVATIVLLVIAEFIAPRTFTPASINAIVIPSAILAIAAIGQTLVIQQKGIDLSVGGMITLAAVATGVINSVGAPIWIAFMLIPFIALVGGVVNGLIVTYLHITPILATLATNSLFFGVVWSISKGTAQQTPAGLIAITKGSAFGMPLIGWIAVGLVAIVAVLMTRTVFGRRYIGVGASPAAARATGVIVHRHIVFGYIASSASSALAGVLLAGYAGTVTYDIGASFQLPVIAAVVVGGAVLSGGRGSVVATAVACLLITLVVQMVLTLGAPTSVQLLVQSIVLGVAATVRLLPWARIAAKLKLHATPSSSRT
jgi:ribose transport system permease protein